MRDKHLAFFYGKYFFNSYFLRKMKYFGKIICTHAIFFNNKT